MSSYKIGDKVVLSDGGVHKIVHVKEPTVISACDIIQYWLDDGTWVSEYGIETKVI